MSSMQALIKKDLKSFFLSPQFYLVAFICTLLWSPIYIFSFGLFLSQLVNVWGAGSAEFMTYQSRVLSEFVSLVHLMLLILVNSVTMRLLTEEKKNNTYELLMTSPLTSWQLVIAKYIVGVIVVSVLVGIAFLYPATTAVLGKISWSAAICSFVGLLLFSAMYVAAGIMVSSLTRSVLLSFLLALIVNIGLWFLGSGAEAFDSGWAHSFFQAVNLDPVFKDFSQGLFRLPGVVLLLSWIGFFLIVTERWIESSRWK